MAAWKSATNVKAARLMGAVERLDLALFVDRRHDGVGRRVHGEADTVFDRLGEGGIVGALEGADAMRPRAVGLPDAPNRARADADGFAKLGGRLDRIEQILATMASTLMAVQEEPRDLREVVLTNHQRRISKLEQTMLGNTPRRRGVSFGRGVPRDWPRRPVNFAQAGTLPLGLSKQESSFPDLSGPGFGGGRAPASQRYDWASSGVNSGWLGRCSSRWSQGSRALVQI